MTHRIPPTMDEADHRAAAVALLEGLIAEAENAFSRAPKAAWSDRTYLAPKDAAKLRGLVESPELAAIKARLSDNATLEWLVYEIFYANPIAFARQNLVISLQRHLLGLPIATAEEVQRQMLDGMTEAERAEWWRGENARRLAVRGVR